MASKGRVGIIGLGIMGGAFARNLIADRWIVAGVDPDPKRRKEMTKAGVAVSDSVKALAAEVPVIITSLPSPAALHAVVQEIADAKIKPRIVIEASTFALDDKIAAEKVLRKAGHTMLDCPVSGTGAQAARKDLVVYASGDRKAIETVMPVFAGFSRKTENLGVFGNGSKMKYVANLLVAIHNVAAAEAMVLGMKAGLEPEQIFKFANGGAGQSRMFEVRGPMMVADDYSEATMKNYVWQKDMAVIGEFAAKLGVPTPMFSATLPVYASAMSVGYAEQDTGAVCGVLEKMAGLKRKKKAKGKKGKKK
ncbi:NAD(P)-dependent oxidoreductase [Pseudorhodoplanes sp.]|uniref:NAD(P)-dependent oxidoreductase n=1 Tax=Pseudorhodoplanes sp. TaxID=1934341 RepID=UPI00391DD9DC